PGSDRNVLNAAQANANAPPGAPGSMVRQDNGAPCNATSAPPAPGVTGAPPAVTDVDGTPCIPMEQWLATQASRNSLTKPSLGNQMLNPLGGGNMLNPLQGKIPGLGGLNLNRPVNQ